MAAYWLLVVVARGQQSVTILQAFCACRSLLVTAAVNRRVSRSTYMSERRRR